MPSVFVLKRLTSGELPWLRNRARPEAGPRLDAELVASALALPEGPVDVRARWYDGQKVIEDLRALIPRRRTFSLAGRPLGSDRFRRAEVGDALALAFEPTIDVTGAERWLLTIDAWLEAERDEDVSTFLRTTLGRKSAVTLSGEECELAWSLARQHLPAFGGGPAWDVEGLSDREWAELRKWLAEHVRVSKLRELLEAASGRHVRSILDMIGAGPGRRFTGRDLAEAVIRRYGVELLSDPERRALLLQERFRRSKVRPRDVSTWSRGSAAAQRFVRKLGLPTVMAGLPAPVTPQVEDLAAFRPLGVLHDYQQQLAAGIRRALHADEWQDKRAVVWLPTGTGKTRTCVETLLMETFLAAPRNVILWVADREELCEQAIESFRHVWMVRGFETPSAREATSPTLRVIRAWGGRPWQEVPNFPTLVVASIQTLAQRVRTPEGSLRLAELGERCAAVVFDEAHHVVAPSYGRVIRALGLGRGKNVLGRSRADGPPLLGLTATPGRSTQDETEALARRFQGRLLEPDEPYRAIGGFIRRGYLSRPRLEVVRTGYVLQQLAEENEHWSRYRQLPPETVVRAGRDVARTAAILADLETRLDSLRSVLVFACSVEHAETMAEVLSRRGHRAIALHGGSPRAARQSAIRRFREGSLRVLVSCDLLTTGFDAPNVDAVAIARPVESRVLYAQMVGRGLRGPRNGGTDRCLILDYEDSSGGYRDLDRLRADFRRSFKGDEEELVLAA